MRWSSIIWPLVLALIGCGAFHPGDTAGGAGQIPDSGGDLPQVAPIVAPPRAQLAELMILAGARHEAPHFTWISAGGAFWQAQAPERESPAVTDVHEGTRGTCPTGMVHVRGAMKLEPPNEPLEDLQLATCTDWINRQYPARCRTFDRAAWLDNTAALPTRAMDFCIDRFEYPNIRGQNPAAFVSANEASLLCAAQGKRLCGEEEWTFACEGEEAVPYSHANGYVRDPAACITDVEWEPPNETALEDRSSRAAALEMDRLWRGKASGTQPRCRSAFGVYDMVGNVDEWTTASPGTEGSRTILKGGYWGPVRARCRPSTRSHDAKHEYFQQGFRCCAGAHGAEPSGASARLPPGRAPSESESAKGT